jgi:hypothetical protein
MTPKSVMDDCAPALAAQAEPARRMKRLSMPGVSDGWL